MKRFAVLCISLIAFSFASAQSDSDRITVPEKMRYCDMDLTLNSAARQYIENVIAKLKPGSSWFNKLAERAAIYFPQIEEAFALAGVPDDLKYIVLQESSLRGDAVSSSNAVGFWQMKKESAREVGLVMDSDIDERRHIYRSSLGAGRYFFRVNRDFDNWVYAIIGYNRGPVGAIPFTDKKMYGKKSMVLTGNTHWYALKAIAYKLAFEDAVAKARPTQSLQTVSTGGETSFNKLAKIHGLEPDELRSYNTWVLGNGLPAGQEFDLYLPREGAPMIASNRPARQDLGVKQIGSDEVPVTKKVIKRNSRQFFYLEPLKDPDYGSEYVHASEGETVVEIAVRNRIKVKKLLAWNGIDAGHRLSTGEIIYLKPPGKSKFYIVQEGDNLKDIAASHNSTVGKIQGRNRMKDQRIYPGQKLYLKGKRSKGEKVILLENKWTEGETAISVDPPSPATTKTSPSETKKPIRRPAATSTKPKSSTSSPSSSSGNTQVHTVKAGETLWRISQDYGVSVEAIRKANRMVNNNIYKGQQLRIPK
jgi:membrane-bound lytic murein transglycosylase D